MFFHAWGMFCGKLFFAVTLFMSDFSKIARTALKGNTLLLSCC